MNPLLVTAFFDIGRGNLQTFRRSTNDYLTSFRLYVARLPAPKYILCSETMRDAVTDAVDYIDIAEFSDLPTYRYLEPTRTVLASEAFKNLFKNDGQSEPENPEYRVPEYCVVNMMKWEALERAFVLTLGRFSHYIWMDFGLGQRAEKRPYLPPPRGVSPIVRDRIVVSAQREFALANLESNSVAEKVRKFHDQVAGGVYIVPAHHVGTFCLLAREAYESLLAMNLASDDQVVADICVARRPDLFYLSFPPRGMSKFSHIHNVLNGLDDTQPSSRTNPVWDRLTHRMVRKLARRRIGL